MPYKNRDRWLWLMLGVGIVLIPAGWIVDYFSSGDPHVLDTLGFITAGIAAAAILSRSRGWDRRGGAWMEGRDTPQLILSGLLFAATGGFTAFFWYCTSSLAAKSAELGLANRTGSTLAWIARTSYDFFLPMLVVITFLAFATFLTGFGKRHDAPVRS